MTLKRVLSVVALSVSIWIVCVALLVLAMPKQNVQAQGQIGRAHV